MSSRLNIGATATIVLLLCGCSSMAGSRAEAGSSNFALSGKSEQIIDIEDARKIIIECFCPTHSLQAGLTQGSVKIVSTGTYSSAGFHGNQDVPGQFDPKWLGFDVKRTGNTLQLISPEYTYIHHALRIGSIVVEAPANVEVVFDVLQHYDLEGRTSGN